MKTSAVSVLLLSASAAAFTPATPRTNPSSDIIVMNNVGSKWAYDPYGATLQENFYYNKDPNGDPYAEDKWYFQPWSYVSQPQFFPLEKTGVDMWYFEPRTVIPPDDEFFHGYNSASHMWVPDQLYAEPQPFVATPPPPAPPAQLGASQQAAVPPMPAAQPPVQQQQQQQQQVAPTPKQVMPEPVPQAMPEPVPQAMPEVDPTMAAFDKAMAGN